MTVLPRVVVAAPATGSGKTTVATGLLAALRRAGHVVSGHKVGPDYIDPGYHALASGRPGRNLDPHLVGEHRIAPLLLHGAAVPTPADVAVVEGVMGLYDGRVGGAGFSSTAHVAHLTQSPVLLVVDVARSSRSLGAVVHGMATYAGAPRIGGVVLNQVGSPRLEAEVRSAIDLPVLGVLPRDEAFATPSRHLGLVPADERDEAAHALDRLAAAVAEHVDLDAVLALARTAPDLDVEPWDPAREVSAGGDARPVVAVAGGRAFTFRYAETEELLRAAGCHVVTFDPTTDTSLPEGTAGVYLGGGFPEVHAAALGDNHALLGDLRRVVAAGVPTVAECAGLLYLADTLDGTAMVGALRAEAAMAPRLTLRYPEATAPADSLLTRAGEIVTGHEFHRTHTEPVRGETAAWTVDGQDVGFAGPTLHASYLHTHWAGHPQLAQRFADAVHGAARRRLSAEASPVDDVSAAQEATPRATSDVSRNSAAPGDPLRHHGDAEVRGEPLLDLAVNVFPGPRPPWLDAALRASLDDVEHYPHPGEAEAYVAARHGREPAEVLATAGAAEAFGLVARLRPWRRPVVVHPQFTEPHAALEQAGHTVTEVHLSAPDFALDPALVPEDADLVVVGNPTNPTGVLHPASAIRALRRPGRLVVVDEAFMDTVPGEPESLSGDGDVVVLRSLTKLWAIPGVRAGYVLGPGDVLAALRRDQPPWSVSTQAVAALVATTGDVADDEARRRAEQLTRWREHLQAGLAARGTAYVASAAPYVLADVGAGVHDRLRRAGTAVRRCDTFPGLGPQWVRIAVRPEATTDRLLDALDQVLDQDRPPQETR